MSTLMIRQILVISIALFVMFLAKPRYVQAQQYGQPVDSASKDPCQKYLGSADDMIDLCGVQVRKFYGDSLDVVKITRDTVGSIIGDDCADHLKYQGLYLVPTKQYYRYGSMQNPLYYEDYDRLLECDSIVKPLLLHNVTPVYHTPYNISKEVITTRELWTREGPYPDIVVKASRLDNGAYIPSDSVKSLLLDVDTTNKSIYFDRSRIGRVVFEVAEGHKRIVVSGGRFTDIIAKEVPTKALVVLKDGIHVRDSVVLNNVELESFACYDANYIGTITISGSLSNKNGNALMISRTRCDSIRIVGVRIDGDVTIEETKSDGHLLLSEIKVAGDLRITGCNYNKKSVLRNILVSGTLVVEEENYLSGVEITNVYANESIFILDSGRNRNRMVIPWDMLRISGTILKYRSTDKDEQRSRLRLLKSDVLAQMEGRGLSSVKEDVENWFSDQMGIIGSNDITEPVYYFFDGSVPNQRWLCAILILWASGIIVSMCNHKKVARIIGIRPNTAKLWYRISIIWVSFYYSAMVVVRIRYDAKWLNYKWPFFGLFVLVIYAAGKFLMVLPGSLWDSFVVRIVG